MEKVTHKFYTAAGSDGRGKSHLCKQVERQSELIFYEQEKSQKYDCSLLQLASNLCQVPHTLLMPNNISASFLNCFIVLSASVCAKRQMPPPTNKSMFLKLRHISDCPNISPELHNQDCLITYFLNILNKKTFPWRYLCLSSLFTCLSLDWFCKYQWVE